MMIPLIFVGILAVLVGSFVLICAFLPSFGGRKSDEAVGISVGLILMALGVGLIFWAGSML